MHLSTEKIPLFSELALVIVLAWVVSGWLLPNQLPKSSTLPWISAISDSALPDLSSLITAPLFGKRKTLTQPAKSVVPITPKPVILSPLNFKLLGTVVAEKHAAAIIAIAAGREQQVFFIGDSIQPGIILKTVEVEAIVVSRGGKLERISLEQRQKLISSPMTKSTLSANSNRLSTQSIHKKISRNHLQKQLQNFPALLSQARAIPHMVNGQLSGFTLSNIAPGSLYQQAGLLNGDIILSVNGKQITGAKQAMQMYTTLKSAAAIDLELIRSGQVRQIHYAIQ